MNRKLSSSKQKARRKDHLFFPSDLLLGILGATLAARNDDSSSGKLHAPYDDETYRFHDHETQSERDTFPMKLKKLCANREEEAVH